MQQYIVTQVGLVSETDKNTNEEQHVVSVWIRQTLAESEEAAIGKFIKAMQDEGIALNGSISCCDLNHIETIR